MFEELFYERLIKLRTELVSISALHQPNFLMMEAITLLITKKCWMR